MHYSIPLNTIKNNFNPIIFSHLIEKSSQLVLNPVDNLPIHEHLAALPSFYQSLLQDLNFTPISQVEVENIILNKDYNLIEDNDNNCIQQTSRLNHIKMIADRMVNFSKHDYILFDCSEIPTHYGHNFEKNKDTDQVNNYSLLDIHTIDDFYQLAATLFRKEMNIILKLQDNVESINIPISHDKESQIFLLSSTQAFNFEKQDINSFFKNSLNNNFQWDVGQELSTVQGDIQFRYYIFNKVAINDDEDLEEVYQTLSLTNHLDLIIELSQNNKDFFTNYINSHINKHNLQFSKNNGSFNKFSQNTDKSININHTLKTEEQLLFIFNLIDLCTQDLYLLNKIWSHPFYISLLPKDHNERPYNYKTSLEHLYCFDKDLLSDKSLNKYKQYYRSHEAGDASFEPYEYIQHDLFNDWASDILHNLDFDNFDSIAHYMSLEYEYIQKQLQPLIDKTKAIYNSTVFNNFNSIVPFLNEHNNILPSVAFKFISQEEQFFCYDQFFEKTLTTKDSNISISLKKLQEIPLQYLTHSDTQTNIKRNNYYLFSLLNLHHDLNQQANKIGIDCKNTSPHFNDIAQLFTKIPNINTKMNLCDYFNNLSNCVLFNNKLSNNFSDPVLKYYHIEAFIEYILIPNKELSIDKDICNLFHKKYRNFYSLYSTTLTNKNIDYGTIFFQFTDIDIIGKINSSFDKCIAHPNYPSAWKLNPDILLMNGKPSLAEFTVEEFNSLFSDEKIGISLIKKDPALYEKLPSHLQEVPEYAKAFITSSSNVNFKFRPILFQYHDFCISLMEYKFDNIHYVPLDHWNNQQFIRDFFKMVDDKDIEFKILEKHLPFPIINFLKHFEIKSNYSPFLEAYILQTHLDNKVDEKINKQPHKFNKKKI